ncbi:hypothetical protein Tco_0879533 [Tanacetum coccineum]
MVRERFSSTEPNDDKERELWVELKRLFEPDTDDLLELQIYMYDQLTWRLYDTCGVHHVSTKTRLDIFMLVVKDYPRGLPMLMLVNKLQNPLRAQSFNSKKLDDLVKRQRIASVHKEASTFKPEEWDNMQAQIEADDELAHRLQAQEREGYFEADKAKFLVEIINERKRQFAQQRAQQRRNRLLTQAQQRSYVCNYIKHMGSHTLQQSRGYSFDEIKVLFEAIMKRVNTFTSMESDDTIPKVVAGSSKRSAKEELGEESLKRQKIGEGSEPAEESKDKESDELSQEQLQ